MNDRILYFFFLIFLFCTVSPALKAQQVLTGQIIDATNGIPIPNASIYIANSTLGTYSDESGNYSVTVQGVGSFEIVVSHVGYQPVFHKIDAPKPFHKIIFALEIKELPEVVVISPSNYKRSDINLFWSKLLGARPSKNGLEIINPEKVYFYRNRDNVLHVSCKEPIEIVNHEMGYRIRYILGNFQHDYRKENTKIIGMAHFEELIPQNSRQKSTWEKKRREVYAISITRFMRALYQDKIHENGFLLTKKDSVYYSSTPFPLNDILQVNQDSVKVMIENPLLLACLSTPVTDRMIQNTWNTIFGNGAKFPVMTLMPQQLTVFADGSYAGILEIQENPYSITGLSSMLPVEYGGNE